MALVQEQFQVSERRACKLLGVDRSTYRYEPRPDHNAELREELVTRRGRSRATATAVCTCYWNDAVKRPA